MNKPMEISNEQIKELLKPIVEHMYILDKYGTEEAFKYFAHLGETHQRLIRIFRDLSEGELINQITFDSFIQDLKNDQD